uniref:pentapeptide repeat-containing protein n=1 Tax=Pseudonocardia acaciae TaxID=551276 RepID=UPI00048A933D
DNVGDDNVGDRNHGNRNQGNDNHGDDNIGNGNHGNRNIGNGNHGDDNIGNDNRGNNNVGDGHHGDNNNADKREKTFQDIVTNPRFLASLGTNGLKNFKRAQGTFGDAAKRHGERAAAAEARGDRATAAKERALEAKYKGLSDQLKDITSPHAKGTPLAERLKRPLGNVPTMVQKFMAQSAFDHMNRPGLAGQHPARNMVPALRDAHFGGDNKLELARRGLTKVGGLATVAFGVWDVVDSVKKGESVPHAVVKTGSSIAISAGAAGLAQAGVAALAVPGAGWAVGAGILVGAGVSYVLTQTDIPNKIADGAVWVGNKIGDGAKAVGNFFKSLF